MAREWYSDSSGLIHLTAFEEGTGDSALDQKGVSIGLYHSGASRLDKCKVVKVTYSIDCVKTNGRFMCGVMNDSSSDTDFRDIHDYQDLSAFPVYAGNFSANYDVIGGAHMFRWSRTWKPKKYAMKADDLFQMTLDPTDFSVTWQFALGIHAVVVPL